MSTRFFTNHTGKSLLQKFKGAFEHIANIHAFHAIVGYFRASGYFAIREHLLKVPEVKILVGINVDKISSEAKKKGLMFFGDPDKSKDEFVRWLRQDILDAEYSKGVEDGILEFMQDIIDGKVQIRVHKTKKLHAKVYIFLPQNFNEYSGGEVITGSSNLTDAGLGTSEDGNYEFNVSLRDYDEIKYAEEEFQRLWIEGEEILPAEIERAKKNTHIGQLFTPFEIYIKLLIEYFGKNIDYDPDSVGDLPRSFKKLSYQVDAVNQGYQMLMEHNGFMLADVVGLGKTVIATMVAKRFLIANGTMNSKILVVYPPHLEKNWKDTFRKFGLDKHAKFISNGSLHKILDTRDNDYWPKEDYDMVLVDESHKFRNHKSQMFNNLQVICKTPRAVEGNVKGFRKKVVLISATPLNNRPEDIYYQLQLFTDARKSTLSITNLQAFFAPLIRQYKELLAASRIDGRPNMEGLRRIYSQIRNKVLQPITVRRTRKDVESYKDYKNDLDQQGIRFPEIADPKAVEYAMDSDLQVLFFNTIERLVNQISYYRYQAIAYLKEEEQEKYYTQAETISRALAQIIMTQMVKRLESSFYAFKISLDKLRVSTGRMIDMFAKGKIFVAPAARVNELMDKGWDDEQIEEYILHLNEEGDITSQVFTPDDFEDEFLEGLKQDLAELEEVCAAWKNVEQDPKWDRFLQLLQTELLRQDLNPSGKLVIFTESKETSKYLSGKMADAGFAKLLTISSENRKNKHETILANFDANYGNEWAHDIDFIISTEVLSEGINLHRANVLVNYDTPWNATKLMQRLGRINRIGSTATIRSYSFYPSTQSDNLIKLYNNAFIKLQGFHTAYGEDARIYTVEEVLEQVKLHIKGLPEEEDKRLKYLEFIRDYKTANEKEFRRIARMPLKARTIRKPDKVQVDVTGCSVVFLKSDYKMEFYKVTPKQCEPLSFVEAAELFIAEYGEVAEPLLPDYHHTQVNAATRKFEEELVLQSTDTISGEQTDAMTNRAKKYIRNERTESKDEKFIEAANVLYALLEKGTFTNLAAEINKIRLKADKNQINEARAHNMLMSLAVKFGAAKKDDEEELEADSSNLPVEIIDEPDIIISETFTS